MASVRFRNGSYQITVSNGRDINGKQIIETTTFKPDPGMTKSQTEKALQRFVINFEDRVKSGKFLSGEKMTYKEYIDLWLKDYAEKQMEQTSVERCKSSLDNIIVPALGHLKLASITPLHIQGLYEELSKTGYTVNGKTKPYNNNTIKRMHQIISSSLNTAVYWQLIESNPCQRVKPPKVEKKADVKHFTLEQAQSFLAYLDTPYMVYHGGRQKKNGDPSAQHEDVKTVPLQYKVFFYMALFGGFRRGELIALTWDDIKFDSRTISITKSSARTKGGIITKSPKTFSSIRDVTLDSGCMDLIQRYKDEQERYKVSLGDYWEGDNYVFIQDNGKQMDISTPNHVFKKIINRYNADESHVEKLPDITLHGLRHTSATLLISQSVDVQTVSGRLGHSETSTTMNIYAHSLKKRDEIASDSLGDLFRK